MTKNKTIRIELFTPGDDEKLTSVRIESVIYAGVRLLAENEEVPVAAVIKWALVDLLASRGIYTARIHGEDLEREAALEKMKSVPGVTLLEHHASEVSQEFVVLLS